MKRFNPAWMVLVLALGACTVAPPAPSVIGPDLGTGDIVAAEAGVIAASHGRARRQGDDLTLTLANGKTSLFHNDNKGCPDGPDHCDAFVLAADRPEAHWFLIFEALYEGGNLVLVDDRDGLKTPIPFWPIFAPDGSRFLILNDDVSDFFPGENLEIWRRSGFTAEREWIANPRESETGVPVSGPYHIRMASWQGDKIDLDFSTDDEFDVKTRTTTPGRHWPATLTHGRDGWTLDARALKTEP